MGFGGSNDICDVCVACLAVVLYITAPGSAARAWYKSFLFCLAIQPAGGTFSPIGIDVTDLPEIEFEEDEISQPWDFLVQSGICTLSHGWTLHVPLYDRCVAHPGKGLIVVSSAIEPCPACAQTVQPRARFALWVVRRAVYGYLGVWVFSAYGPCSQWKTR
jgi:hypothetical protein